MRKRLLLAVILCRVLTVAAQDSVSVYRSTVDQFSAFYKQQQPDSIYKLFAVQLQSKLLPSLWAGSFAQLLRTAGNLGTFHEIPSAGAGKSFLTSTDNPSLDLKMQIDSSGYIEGLRIVQKTVAKTTSHSNFIIHSNGGSLYGTLSLPNDTAAVPVVLIIPGSGPTDREGNNPLGVSSDSYKMLAEGLHDSGVASLRYDKRLIGESKDFEGSPDSVSFEDMVQDARTIVDSLKKDPRFSSVAVLGHSEGSLIGMISARLGNADKYISVAGIGTGADTVLLKQLDSGGLGDQVPLATRLFDSLKMGFRVSPPGQSLDAIFSPSLQKYVASWISYHPREEIAKLHIPVLIIQGNHDIQVDPSNADSLKSSCPQAKLVFIRTMNHILKDAPADRQQNLESYKNIYQPINREFVRTVVAFVKN
jgi:uncharacterized protein